MIPHLMGRGRRDQRYKPFDELTSLHEDVGGAVAPEGLQAESESPVRVLIEAIVRQWRPRNIPTEPLETAAVSHGDRDGSMEAHPSMLGHPRRLRGRADGDFPRGRHPDPGWHRQLAAALAAEFALEEPAGRPD